MVVRPHEAAGGGQARRQRVITTGVLRHAVKDLDGEADIALGHPAPQCEGLVAVQEVHVAWTGLVIVATYPNAGRQEH